MRGDGRARVGHGDDDAPLPGHGPDLHGRPLVAVGDRVAQQVAEDARETGGVGREHERLAGIVDRAHAPLHRHARHVAVGGKRRVELVGELDEKTREVHRGKLELYVREAVARDVEELVDQALEPARLVERDAGVAGALRLGQVGHLVEQREVADHRGERSLEVVRQVGHEVAPASGLVCELALLLGRRALGI